MAPYKFDSASCFLTYAQSSLTNDVIIDHLRSIKDIEWARICQERHQDGGTHQHVVAKFTDRVQSRNPRIFDINGVHPNIQRIKSIKQALQYVSKDGEFQDFGTVPGKRYTGSQWLQAAATSTKSSFMADAFDGSLNASWAQIMWDCGNVAEAPEIRADYEPDLSRECERLQTQELPENSCAVVIGPTGCGKTSWAKRVAPKPALWVRQTDVLRLFRPDYHKSIIFDDMDFSQTWPVTSQIHLTDWYESSPIRCRYSNASIPAGTVKIFTCNSYPFSQHPAIARRVTEINLY